MLFEVIHVHAGAAFAAMEERSRLFSTVEPAIDEWLKGHLSVLLAKEEGSNLPEFKLINLGRLDAADTLSVVRVLTGSASPSDHAVLSRESEAVARMILADHLPGLSVNREEL